VNENGNKNDNYSQNQDRIRRGSIFGEK